MRNGMFHMRNETFLKRGMSHTACELCLASVTTVTHTHSIVYELLVFSLALVLILVISSVCSRSSSIGTLYVQPECGRRRCKTAPLGTHWQSAAPTETLG